MNLNNIIRGTGLTLYFLLSAFAPIADIHPEFFSSPTCMVTAQPVSQEPDAFGFLHEMLSAHISSQKHHLPSGPDSVLLPARHISLLHSGGLVPLDTAGQGGNASPEGPGFSIDRERFRINGSGSAFAGLSPLPPGLSPPFSA